MTAVIALQEESFTDKVVSIVKALLAENKAGTDMIVIDGMEYRSDGYVKFSLTTSAMVDKGIRLLQSQWNCGYEEALSRAICDGVELLKTVRKDKESVFQFEDIQTIEVIVADAFGHAPRRHVDDPYSFLIQHVLVSLLVQNRNE